MPNLSKFPPIDLSIDAPELQYPQNSTLATHILKRKILFQDTSGRGIYYIRS